MVAEPRGTAFKVDERDIDSGMGGHQLTRSTIAAMPWPPPMHSEARP